MSKSTKKEKGFDHQVQMPNVLNPDLLLTDFQQAEKHRDELAEKYQLFLMAHPKVFEFKPVGKNIFMRKENDLPYNHCWLRLKDKIDTEFTNVYRLMNHYKTDMRTAAYIHALNRLSDAVSAQGTHGYFSA